MRRPSALLKLVYLFCVLLGPLWAAKIKWDPIDSQLLGGAPGNNETIDAEFLFSRYAYEGFDGWSSFDGYCRVKVHTEKGVADSRKLEIKLDKGERAISVQARVHRKDGSVYELKDQDFIHSRDKKRNTSKEGKITFVLPDLSPGEVFEYAWRTRRDEDVWVLIFDVQKQLPIREFEYRFTPGLFKRLIFVANTKDAKIKNDGDRAVISLRGIPAFEEEPLMPPVSDYSIWLGMVPIFDQRNAKELWDNVAKDLHDDFKEKTKPNGAIKDAALAIVGGETDPANQLRKIYDYCQRDITNLTYDRSSATESTRKKRAADPDEEWSAREVLKAKMGNKTEILHLFGALCRAVGLEGELVAYPPATMLREIRTMQGWCFLSEKTVAFQFGANRVYCSPDDPFLPFGMRPWNHETASAIIARPNAPVFTVIPVSDPELTRIHEKLTGSIDIDGNLEATVTREFNGMEAWDKKTDRVAQTQEEFDEDFIADINSRLPHAEVTELTWKNLTTRDLPLSVSYKMKVPNYAEVIGTRLSVPLNPLRSGSKSPFTAEKRKYPVLFKKTSHVVTQIELAYPESFAPDAPTLPRSAGNNESAVSVRYSVQMNLSRRVFVYKRDLIIGRGPGKEFPVESYAAFRQFYELLDQGDNHVVLLKPISAESAAKP